MKTYGLIVCDASPLITLAKAQALDVLLRQPWPIRIPDAVYREAASEAHEDGVRIAKWVAAHDDRVQLTPTEAGIEQDILLRSGAKARNAGENAALEVINRFLEKTPDLRAILLYEDDDVRRLPMIERAEIMTTGSFLFALERAGLIQSVDRILDEAANAGRNVEGQRGERSEDSVRDLVDELRRHGG